MDNKKDKSNTAEQKTEALPEDIIQCKEVALKDILALAFVGDAVWTLCVRELLTQHSNSKVGQLHINTAHYVCAKAQSDLLEKIEPVFTELEADIARRARNAHNNTVPKNAVLADYKRATAFEAVIGYNYLCKNTARVRELFALTQVENEIKK